MVVHFASAGSPEPGVEMLVHFDSSSMYRLTVRRLIPSSRAMRRWDQPF